MPAGSVQPTEPQPFDLASVRGLSQDDVARRLAQDGPNELPASRPKTLVGIALEVVREPMFLLLVAAASIYLLVGDLSEGLLLLAFVLVVMGITLYQQRKTERALEALRDLSSPRALVIRNGERKRIPGRDVVRGDLLMLAEGDRVPADGVLLDGIGLTVDESLLTGESVPVRKRAGATDGHHGPPRRRRPPVPLLGNARRSRAGCGTRRSDGGPHRTREDRPGAAVAGAGSHRDRARDAPARSPAGGARRRLLRARRRGLRPHPRQLAGRTAGRHHLRDGDAPRGVSRRPHHLPGARRVAAVASATCSRGAWPPSRRLARPPCCAWTRPARSRSTRWPSGACG